MTVGHLPSSLDHLPIYLSSVNFWCQGVGHLHILITDCIWPSCPMVFNVGHHLGSAVEDLCSCLDHSDANPINLRMIFIYYVQVDLTFFSSPPL